MELKKFIWRLKLCIALIKENYYSPLRSLKNNFIMCWIETGQDHWIEYFNDNMTIEEAIDEGLRP